MPWNRFGRSVRWGGPAVARPGLPPGRRAFAGDTHRGSRCTRACIVVNSASGRNNPPCHDLPNSRLRPTSILGEEDIPHYSSHSPKSMGSHSCPPMLHVLLKLCRARCRWLSCAKTEASELVPGQGCGGKLATTAAVCCAPRDAVPKAPPVGGAAFDGGRHLPG